VEEAVSKKVKYYIKRTGETVAKAYEEDNIPIVEEYVMRDVEATHQLFIKIEQYIM
jgi:hypothetical protein